MLVAEDVSSRFLNVISLFNGTIPLITIQMQALKVGEQVALVFTTVIDELTRAIEEEEEEEEVNRAYWETKAAKSTVAIADDVLKIIHEFDPTLSLKYNKLYIGLAKDGQPRNFVTLQPRKNSLRALIALKQSENVDQKIESRTRRRPSPRSRRRGGGSKRGPSTAAIRPKSRAAAAEVGVL